jgi:ppGpp synthetase/RelA/SpoT-type nucleotidyltranferase
MNKMAEPQADLMRSFKTQSSLYEAFTSTVKHIVETLIVDAKAEYDSIEGRTKSAESFERKISRDDKAGKYKKLEEVTDISGIRIICYLKEDCDRISEIIKNCFKVDEANSLDKEDTIDDDRFGYRSIHYVVSFDDLRSSVTEYKRFSGLKAEIQIRTILQHTWAAIDWKFRYKNESEAPRLQTQSVA